MAGEDAAEGTPFGRYRLVRLLGRGGMGEVWRAYDTATDRIVAIKLLPAHYSDNDEFRRRFRREAHAAARLDTPHVVPIYDYGEIDGRLFVSMRLIGGRDLQAALADGPIAPARTVRIIEGVADALHSAHKVGLVHRDVKPSNILLDENDFAYLIDFGIARAADETRMTKSGYAPGTFQYIAPERLGARTEEDARADIYSLACVLYECLTGRPPFEAVTMAGQVAAHLHSPPPQPSISRPNVPAQFDAVIAKGMAKDPDDRYATTVELADAAHDAITVPIQRPQPGPPSNTHTEQADTVASGVPYDEPPQPPSAHADETRTLAATVEGQDNKPADAPTQLAPTQPAGVAKSAPPPATAAPSRGWFATWGWALSLVAAIVVIGTAIPIMVFVGHSKKTPNALDGLLLSPDQIGAVMGTSGMESKGGVFSNAWSINVTVVTPANINCLAVAYAAENTAYKGSGWTAMRAQEVRNSGSQLIQLVSQNVVAFSSADAAAAVYAASSRSWSACANTRWTETSRADGSTTMWSAGSVSDQNGWLTISATREDIPTITRQRAMTARKNIVIDVSTVSDRPSSQLAVDIAKQIAAKVPT
ncbi:serine/threonine-protein kinase PknH/PknJ [Mycobacterium sp. E2479]|uniref:serine/threonine-protein kinase PknH/PknJ n=1 Tax=Mycobacterium sp. E2479 TaxID=1834134 RepID=UPI000A5D5486|nr:serine/threonine-protein kinase PknH/PknJ [Mycobacterium sp. E2479]